MEIAVVLATIFTWILGLGLIIVSLNLPYYFMQYQLLVLGIALVFFIFGLVLVAGFATKR